jgi:hypothetical protein
MKLALQAFALELLNDSFATARACGLWTARILNSDLPDDEAKPGEGLALPHFQMGLGISPCANKRSKSFVALEKG